MYTVKTFLRAFVGIFNLIFTVIGGGLLALGAWMRITNDDFASLFGKDGVSSVENSLMITGGVILFIGCLGFWAVCKNNRTVLCVYSVLIMIVLGIEITGTVMLHQHKQKVIDKLEENIRIAIKKSYGNTDDAANAFTKSVDYVQKTLKCCGASNFTDWKGSHWYKVYGMPSGNDVPATCCKDPKMKECGKNIYSDLSKINTKGCVDSAIHFFRENISGLGSTIGIGTSVFQIFGVLGGWLLFRKLGSGAGRGYSNVVV